MSFTEDIIKVKEDYFMAVEGHMSQETFKCRIKSLNEIIKRTNSPQLMQFFCLSITFNIIIFPIIFVAMFFFTAKDQQDPLMNIMLGALGNCLFLFMLRSLVGRRYLRLQKKNIRRQLMEFNRIDNSNYVNWKAIYETSEKTLILELISPEESTLIQCSERIHNDDIINDYSSRNSSITIIPPSPIPPPHDVVVNIPPPA
ncbi:13448_t:CDS:2 [Ambispora leptoticha]|uniref:13448_t:CDS:1 n=1 Tax=Ambispora leptoticha TaxID=144679 RepID=A0A9N9D7G7_9GLOM|nr:13448_t:CDS:2 [Ambispora leptoticha]